MKKVLFLFSVLLILGGCAARDAQINPLLNSMSHVNQAIHAFGPPVQASDMHDGAKIYVWSTNRNVQMGGIPVYQPNNQTHTGSVYSPTGGYAGTYSGQSHGSGTVSYTPVQNVNFACTLQMIVEQNGAIRTWSYQGNACDELIRNASLPPTAQNNTVYIGSSANKNAPGARPGLHSCLEQLAKDNASKGLDLDSLSGKIEFECEQETGGRIPNLAKYYARQALDSE